jgi:hypothetical protein
LAPNIGAISTSEPLYARGVGTISGLHVAGSFNLSLYSSSLNHNHTQTSVEHLNVPSAQLILHID